MAFTTQLLSALYLIWPPEIMPMIVALAILDEIVGIPSADSSEMKQKTTKIDIFEEYVTSNSETA